MLSAQLLCVQSSVDDVLQCLAVFNMSVHARVAMCERRQDMLRGWCQFTKLTSVCGLPYGKRRMHVVLETGLTRGLKLEEKVRLQFTGLAALAKSTKRFTTK